MAYRVFLIFQLASYVTTSPFQPVSSSCIYWDFLNVYPNGDTETLHCIVDEKNQLGIVNVEWKWVANGFCPYYDRFSKQIHAKPCDTKLGSCPDKKYFSFQAVKYSACMETNIRNDITSTVDNPDEQGRTVTTPQLNQDTNRHSDTLPAINVAVSCLILLILVGIQIKEYLQQRKKKRKEDTPKDDTKKSQKLLNDDNDNDNVQQETEDMISYLYQLK